MAFPTPCPPPTPPPRVARWADAATAALFAAWLVVPFGATALRVAPDPAASVAWEKRRLVDWPAAPVSAAAWRALPAAVEAAAQDRLAWRARLIGLHNRGLVALRTSPRPEVIVGRDGGLFYDPFRLRGGARVPGYGATSALPPGQVRLIARVLEERRAWLAEHGIGYLVVLIPDKQSVYPDRLPPHEARRAQPRSIAGQVVDELRQRTAVDVLDLTDALRAARPLGELFFRNDTHWTPLGVAAGAAAIQRHLRARHPAMPAFPDSSAWTLGPPAAPPQLDLARLLSIERWRHETAPTITLANWTPARVVRRGVGTDPVEYKTERDDLPSAWVLHDSFTGLLHGFLAPCFRRSLFQWHIRAAFLPADILAWRPDLVVEIFVERHATLWQGNPPDVTALAERKLFEASDRPLAFRPAAGVAPPPGAAVRHPAGPDGRCRARLPGIVFEPGTEALLRLTFRLPSPAATTLEWKAGPRHTRRLAATWEAGEAEWFVRLTPPLDDGPFRLTVEGPPFFELRAPAARAVAPWATEAAGAQADSAVW